MGKHSEKSKGLNGKKIVLVLMLILIIVSFIVGIIYISKNKNIDITSTENGPIISYYDEKNKIKMKIENNSIINKKVTITYDKGTAKISKDGGKYTKYNGGILEDGIYKVKAEAEDKTATVVAFEVDTTPPKIEGIKNGAWVTTAQTITFNIDDIKTLKIERDDKEIATEKDFMGSKGIVSYKLEEYGKYNIYAEDYNGNDMEDVINIWKE